MTTKQKKLVCIVCIATIAALVACLACCGRSTNDGQGEIQREPAGSTSMAPGASTETPSTSSATVDSELPGKSNAQDAVSAPLREEADPDSEAAEDTSPTPSEEQVGQNVLPDSSMDSNTQPDSPSAPGNSGESFNPAQRTWVVDYKQIWVVDNAAWDESIPVYSTEEVSICNICGAEITGSEAAHAKKHMLAGEGSGHHSGVRQVLSGYSTVHHDETGHWETIENGGHWE